MVQEFFILLQDWIGTSYKLNNFLNIGFLAAHYLRSSIGNVKIVTAKNIKNKSLIKFPRQNIV
jgi:hypothetical protein